MRTPSGTTRLVEQARERTEAMQSWASATIFWRVWERLLENEFVDRSVALGAKAFVSLFPAVIVVTAFLPASVRTSVQSTISRRAGVSGESLSAVRSAFATSSDVRKATGVIGLLFAFFYINSFVQALQRVYLRAWRRPPPGRMSARAFGVLWFGALFAYFGLLGGTRALLNYGPQTALFLLVAWVGTAGIWSLTSWLMLQRQIRLRALVATGIVTGTGLALYALTASLWMPRTVSENQQQYGFFGIAGALVSWLTGFATIILIGACAGSVLAEDTGWLGRLARGPAGSSVLAPRAAPALPAPAASPSLSAALGLHRGPGAEPPAPNPRQP